MAHKGEKENGSHYSSSGATKNIYSKKKRTSFVNENEWWEKLSEGMKSLKKHYSQPWPPANAPKFSEGTSRRYRQQKKGHFAEAMQDPWNARKKKKSVKSEAEMRANQNRVIGSDAQWKKLRQEHWNVFKDPNKPKDYWEKKRRSDRESGYGSY